MVRFWRAYLNEKALSYLELVAAVTVLAVVLLYAARAHLFSGRSELAARELTGAAMAVQGLAEVLEAGLSPQDFAGYLAGGFEVEWECPSDVGEVPGLAYPYRSLDGYWVRVRSPLTGEGVYLPAYRLKAPQFPYLTGINPNGHQHGLPADQISPVRVTAQNTHFQPGVTVLRLGPLVFSSAEGGGLSVINSGELVVTDTAALTALAVGSYDLQVETGSEKLPPLGPPRDWVRGAYEVWAVPPPPPPPLPDFTFEPGDWEYTGNWEIRDGYVWHRSENWQPAYYKKVFNEFRYVVFVEYREGPGRNDNWRAGLVVDPSMSSNPELWYYIDRTPAGKVALYQKRAGSSPQLLEVTDRDLLLDTPYALEAVLQGGVMTLKFEGRTVSTIQWSGTGAQYLGVKDEAKGVEVYYRFPVN